MKTRHDMNSGADDPSVTVVAACYNHGPYVVETLDSILAQDYGNLELIIIDDCSRDDSEARIRRWIAREGAACLFIAHEENRGVCASLNEAIALSKGKYIRFIACDDVMTHGSVRKQVEILENEGPDAALVCGNALEIDPDGAEIGPYFPPSYTFPRHVFEAVLKGHEGKPIVIHSPTVMLRRRVFDEVGPYPVDMMQEDFYMWLTLSSRCDIIFRNEIFVHYRVLPSSMSNDPDNRLRLLSDRLRVVERIRHEACAEALRVERVKILKKILVHHLSSGDDAAHEACFDKLMALHRRDGSFRRDVENALKQAAKNNLPLALHLYRKHTPKIENPLLKLYLAIRIPFLGSRLSRAVGACIGKRRRRLLPPTPSETNGGDVSPSALENDPDFREPGSPKGGHA